MPVLSLPLTEDQAVVPVRLAVRPSRARQLQRAGLVVPQPITTSANIDTGSVFTLVAAHLLAALGLTTSAVQVPATTAAGSGSFPRFHVSLTVLHPQPRQSLWVQSQPVLSADLGQLELGVVIGCDLLKRCAFTFDGPGGRFLLSW